MAERRKSLRFYLNYSTSVYDAETNQQLGKLMDISSEGAMLVGNSPLPIGKDFRLKVKLEKKLSEKSFLELKAVSIWSHPDIEPGTFNTGFELMEPKPEEMDILLRLAITDGTH